MSIRLLLVLFLGGIQADQGDLLPFAQFITNAVIETQTLTKEEIEKYLEDNVSTPTPTLK